MILVTCECNYTRNEGGDAGGWRGDQHLSTQCLREGGGMHGERGGGDWRDGMYAVLNRL